MFIIASMLASMFEEPTRKPTVWPVSFEIVDTIGRLAAERKVPARTYVIIQIPDSSLHYGLVDDRGELTDWIASPIPNR